MSVRSWLAAFCCLTAVLAPGADVAAAPQTGWCWNPTESGRGFFVESDNGITFIGAYVYDTDGHATWLVAGDANPDPYNYTGQLYSMSGGQTLLGNYVAPKGPNYAGTISVHFSDDTHGTVTWPGGTVAIERQRFGGDDALFQPDPGWWWNADESGSGYSIEVQGDNLFFVGFMYDASGRPVWYYSAGPLTTPTRYQGSLLQFANGQNIGGPYKPPSTPAPVGSVDIDFMASDLGALKFYSTSSLRAATDAAPARTVNFRPQFAKYKTPGPLVYVNKLLVTQTIRPLPNYTYKLTYSGDLRWERYSCGTPDSACYFAKFGTMVVNANGTWDPAPGVHCTAAGVKTFNRFSPTASYLEIAGLTWQASIDLRGKMDVTYTCTVAGITESQTEPIDIGWTYQTKNRSVQDQVPSPATYADGFDGDIQNAKGAFYSNYQVQNPLSGAIVESGYVIFFPN